ncbi:sugar ABC transporter ATPase [Bacillus paramycoides]|nr:sugar ABC transporter ATPase [Bacillus paramycoides]
MIRLWRRGSLQSFLYYFGAYTLLLFILAFISSIMFVINNGMGELMIAVFLGLVAVANLLLLLALKVVRTIVAKGK